MNSKILLLLVGIVIGGIYVTFRFTGQIWGVKTRIIMKKDYFLGREYGVLPRWMQFIVFIHSNSGRVSSNFCTSPFIISNSALCSWSF